MHQSVFLCLAFYGNTKILFPVNSNQIVLSETLVEMLHIIPTIIIQGFQNIHTKHIYEAILENRFVSKLPRVLGFKHPTRNQFSKTSDLKVAFKNKKIKIKMILGNLNFESPLYSLHEHFTFMGVP